MAKKLFDIYFAKPAWTAIVERVGNGYMLKQFVAALKELYRDPSLGKIFYCKNSLENGGSELSIFLDTGKQKTEIKIILHVFLAMINEQVRQIGLYQRNLWPIPAIRRQEIEAVFHAMNHFKIKIDLKKIKSQLKTIAQNKKIPSPFREINGDVSQKEIITFLSGDGINIPLKDILDIIEKNIDIPPGTKKQNQSILQSLSEPHREVISFLRNAGFTVEIIDQCKCDQPNYPK